jgi:uncharacterized membrane protein
MICLRKLSSLGLVAVTLTSVSAASDFYSFNSGWGTSVFNITPDGMVAVGVSDGAVFRWTPSGGAAMISPADWLNTFTAGVSNDGNTIVSSMINPSNNQQEAAVWRAHQGWSFLGGLTAGVEGNLSTAYDVSGDATKIVGLGWHTNWRAEGFLWQDSSGMSGLGRPENMSSRASRISRDGSLIIGWYENNDTGERRPARWVNGGAVDLYMGETAVGETLGTNSDGSILVGEHWVDGVGSRGYFYDSIGVHDFGLLPGHENNFSPRSLANGVSDDSIVVGYSGGDPFWGDQEEAFVWTLDSGMVTAASYLLGKGISVPSHLKLTSATSISADGKTIGGQAFNMNTNFNEAWVATSVPEPGSMIALTLGIAALLRRRFRKTS